MTSPKLPDGMGDLPGSLLSPGLANLTGSPIIPFQSPKCQQLDQFLRILPLLEMHLNSVFSLMGKVLQCLQENLRQLLSQAKEVCPEKETEEIPKIKPLEDPYLKAFMMSWLSRKSADTAEPLETRPSGAREPGFWQDILTDYLWKVFTDIPKKEQPTHGNKMLDLESEDPGFSGSKADLNPEGILSCLAPILSQPLPSSFGVPQEETSKPHMAQDPASCDHRFLKLCSWDPEDFEDSWKKLSVSGRLAVPRTLQSMCVLKHGGLVLGTAVSSFTRHAFTCSKGGVKVWSLTSQVAKNRFPESHLKIDTQSHGAYLRTCLLSPDSRTLFAGGHHLPGVSVWDLTAPSLHEKQQLPCQGLSCQALATSVEDSTAFAGFTDGTVRMWDLRSHSVVSDLSRNSSGIKSLVVKEHNLWTGGTDACLRCWDLRTVKEPLEYTFESQIMSLSHSPQEDWLLLGMANGQHWLHSTDTDEQKLLLSSKDKTVHGVKFSPDGRWFVSVGTDDLLTIHSMPTGTKILQVCEGTSVICCDISSNGRLIVTGSGDHATVYRVTY